MKVLLVGAAGQLGTDLADALTNRVDLLPLTHAQIDITDRERVDQALAAHTPDLVINTAAYNRVDDCEDQLDFALHVNTVGPYVLARACRSSGAALLHVSTDYVFSGESDRPWRETDTPQPVNAYGLSKLAGELAVRAACPDSYVVRVSGLFGLKGSRVKGGNFVETMLRLQAEHKPIRVVDDQTLAPTATRDLASKLAELILTDAPCGTYHMTASGACSWYEFARAIFEFAGLDVDLRPQSTDALAVRARRPRYSVLANDMLHAIGLAQIRPWPEGLRDYLAARAEAGHVAA
jgi:dTDP-4-dehydrorhamnose reductase